MADMNNLRLFIFSSVDDEDEQELPSVFEHYQNEKERQRITEVLADWDNQRRRLRELRDRENAFDDVIDEHIKGKKTEEYSNGDPEYDRLKKEKAGIFSEISSQYPEHIQDLLAVSDPKQMLEQLRLFDAIKDDKEQLKNFTFLANLQENLSEGRYAQKDNANIVKMEQRPGQNGSQIMLRVKNLGGTGLEFAIQDGRSILFAKDRTLTENQISELGVFFEENDMKIEDFSQFEGLTITNEQGEESKKSFQDIFEGQEYQGKTLEELQKIEYELRTSGKDVPAKLDQLIGQMAAEEEFADLNQTAEVKGAEEDAVDSRQAGQTDDRTTSSAAGSVSAVDPENGGVEENAVAPQGFGAVLAGLDKEPVVTFKKMRGALKARAGIMRVDKKCIVERRMADGSICISFYKSESDMYADNKIGKDGIVQHKKMVAFRLYKNPPKIGIYVPTGAEFKTAYAKGALKALKSCGYKYFIMPGADEFGGDAQKAFWEAAGDQLMCPRLKSKEHPDGCNMGNDHLSVLLKAIEDKNDGSEYDVLVFKMRLAEEIRGHLDFTAGHDEESWKKDNGPLRDSMMKLEGDVRFHSFSGTVLPDLMKRISNNTQLPAGDKNKWNVIDVASAYEAINAIAEGVEKGVLSYKDANGKMVTHQYDYLDSSKNQAFIDEMFKAKMAEARDAKIATFKSKLKPGSNKDGDEYGSEEYDFSLEEEGGNNKRFSQNDFNKAGNDTMTEAREKLSQTFKNISARYPGCKKAEFKIEQPRSVDAIDRRKAKEQLSSRRTMPARTGGYSR